MALPIVWTENGIADYKQVIDYLLQEWPIKAASDLVKNVELRVETLSVFPEMELLQ